jgi:hypothetical protein
MIELRRLDMESAERFNEESVSEKFVDRVGKMMSDVFSAGMADIASVIG